MNRPGDKGNSSFKKMSNRNGHSRFEVSNDWAVSYSDLLMVLMSFFIIYMNINDGESTKRSKFNHIIMQIAEKADLVKITEYAGQVQKEESHKTKSRVSSQKLSLTFAIDMKKNKELSDRVKIKRSLASREENKFVEAIGLGLKGEASSNTSIPREAEVNIDFSENIYKVGEYKLTGKIKEELNQIFKIIGPSKDYVRLVFVGHTDKLKYNDKSGNVINSNLILSSLRAAKAVEYALAQGFDKNKVFVQGLTVRPRGTRSLSLRLVER